MKNFEQFINENNQDDKIKIISNILKNMKPSKTDDRFNYFNFNIVFKYEDKYYTILEIKEDTENKNIYRPTEKYRICLSEGTEKKKEQNNKVWNTCSLYLSHGIKNKDISENFHETIINSLYDYLKKQ